MVPLKPGSMAQHTHIHMPLALLRGLRNGAVAQRPADRLEVVGQERFDELGLPTRDVGECKGGARTGGHRRRHEQVEGLAQGGQGHVGEGWITHQKVVRSFDEVRMVQIEVPRPGQAVEAAVPVEQGGRPTALRKREGHTGQTHQEGIAGVCEQVHQSPDRGWVEEELLVACVFANLGEIRQGSAGASYPPVDAEMTPLRRLSRLDEPKAACSTAWSEVLSSRPVMAAGDRSESRSEKSVESRPAQRRAGAA